MASSDPPFDAADLPTTQPLRPDRQSTDSAPEPPATIPLRTNTNWFDPSFDADHVATTAATQPVEPTTMDVVAAEIAAALAPPEPVPERPEVAPEAPKVAPEALMAALPVFMPVAAAASASVAVPIAQHNTSRFNDIATRAGKVVALVAGGWFCAVLVLIVLYRFINPPFSTLMAMQWIGGTEIHQEWVPLEEISPSLIHAVVVSEDGRFCEHWGIDFVEIAYALRRTPFGPPRGASTITMQVAKNLFLWPAKSYLRKLIEVPLTYAIELFWPKRRILEVYLNIAEWGPGVFGAEAASQAHFGRPASRLSARQAAQLAVALPNPIVRDAGSPGPRTAHRASVIQRRTGHEPEAVSCVMPGG